MEAHWWTPSLIDPMSLRRSRCPSEYRQTSAVLCWLVSYFIIVLFPVHELDTETRYRNRTRDAHSSTRKKFSSLPKPWPSLRHWLPRYSKTRWLFVRLADHYPTPALSCFSPRIYLFVAFPKGLNIIEGAKVRYGPFGLVNVVNVTDNSTPKPRRNIVSALVLYPAWMELSAWC